MSLSVPCGRSSRGRGRGRAGRGASRGEFENRRRANAEVASWVQGAAECHNESYDQDVYGSLLLVDETADTPAVEIAITEDEIWIGRNANCHVRVGHKTVSGRHCRIKCHGTGPSAGSAVLQDMSTNGTLHNGKIVGNGYSLNLADGDRIGIADAATYIYRAGTPGPETATPTRAQASPASQTPRLLRTPVFRSGGVRGRKIRGVGSRGRGRGERSGGRGTGRKAVAAETTPVAVPLAEKLLGGAKKLLGGQSQETAWKFKVQSSRDCSTAVCFHHILNCKCISEYGLVTPFAFCACTQTAYPPKCKAGHEMAVSEYAGHGYESGYRCDSCSNRSTLGHLGGSLRRWYCTQCSADLCLHCVPVGSLF